MSETPGTEYRFACPVCDESLTVNESMKAALVERGCVICGSAVSEDAFSVQCGAGTPSDS